MSVSVPAYVLVGHLLLGSGLGTDSLVLLAPAAVCGPGVCGACDGLKFWTLRCGWLVRGLGRIARYGRVSCLCERL